MNTTTKVEKRNGAADVQHTENAAKGFVSPRVNITETKDGYLLEAEMPGVNKDGLEVSLEGNELTLIGRRYLEFAGVDVLYRESHNRDFRRAFVLDPTIDTAKIEAKMDNGVLKLHLPKAEVVKPRKITVTD